MYIDTHAHLYLEQFNEDIDQVLARAQNSGVGKIFLPNINSETLAAMNNLGQQYPKLCYPLIGLHPCYVKENYKDELAIIESELAQGQYYGIGETGIDLYWDLTYKTNQIRSFEFQIDLAKKYKLPIIIHSRDCLDLTLDIIESNQDGTLTGIFHCFNGDKAQCKKAADMGFHMGLGGVITFKKANLGDMVAYAPQDYLLLETDAPYLSPAPNRGKRNESGYLPLVAMKMAEFRSQPVTEIRDFTTANAEKLFKINAAQV